VSFLLVTEDTVSKNIAYFILVFAVISTSCVRSIHPFYEDGDAYFDASLIGKWSDEGRTESWVFEKAGSSEYRMEYTDENGRTGTFEARLFKIRNRIFMDITPVRSPYVQGFYGGHLLSVHTFFGLELGKDSAKLMYLDPAWLKRHLQNSPGAVEHTTVDGEVLLTDSTKKLKAFISTHLDTPGAFEQTEIISKIGAN
jgi:hypothetical protein